MKILSRRPEKMEKKIYDTIRPAEVSPLFIKVRPFLRVCAFSLRFPAENFTIRKFCRKNAPKTQERREGDSEGENCDRRSACATRKRTVREPLFMPYPGMRPLSSPAVVKALLLPLHCICGLFCPYPRPPVLPVLSLRKTAYRNGWRDTDFFRIWRNIPKKRVEDGLLFGCITTKLYFCKK